MYVSVNLYTLQLYTKRHLLYHQALNNSFLDKYNVKTFLEVNVRVNIWYF